MIVIAAVGILVCACGVRPGACQIGGSVGPCRHCNAWPGNWGVRGAYCPTPSNKTTKLPATAATTTLVVTPTPSSAMVIGPHGRTRECRDYAVWGYWSPPPVNAGGRPAPLLRGRDRKAGLWRAWMRLSGREGYDHFLVSRSDVRNHPAYDCVVEPWQWWHA